MTYIPLEEPSDNCINNLTHVYFGIRSYWNTDNENDNDDNNLWFDAVSDDEEITYVEFLDYCDGWNLFPNKLKNSS